MCICVFPCHDLSIHKSVCVNNLKNVASDIKTYHRCHVKNVRPHPRGEGFNSDVENDAVRRRAGFHVRVDTFHSGERVGTQQRRTWQKRVVVALDAADLTLVADQVVVVRTFRRVVQLQHGLPF